MNPSASATTATVVVAKRYCDPAWLRLTACVQVTENCNEGIVNLF
jgi:hypothetical protein